MIGKSLAVGIVIGGAVSASFNRSLKTAEEKTSLLGAALAKSIGQKETIARFKTLGKTIGKTAREMKAAQGNTAGLAKAIAKSEANIKKLQAAGEKTGATLAGGMNDAKQATLTWSQFTSQRMSKYMKELGGHTPAIRKISAEWKVYKAEHGKAMKGATKTANTELDKEQAALKKLQSEFKRSAATSGRLKNAQRRQKDELRSVRSELRGAGVDTRRLGEAEKILGKSIDKTNRAMDRQRRKARAGSRLAGLKNKAIGAVGSLYGVGRIVGNNAEFEHALTMLSNTGNLSREQIAKIRKKLKSESLKVNQSKSDLLGGIDFLVGKGLNTRDAVTSIHAIGIAATGSGASVTELSQTTFAMIDNMKLSSAEVASALDIIAASGKQGGFELRDMARFFPSLTAQAQVLGLKGKEGIASIGAALQIARKGSGTAEEAANNMQNFLSKITSKETVNNLEKLGVSVRDVFDNAKASGKNPLIAIIQKIKEVTGGDSFALNKIFGDMQVKNFLNPMLANIDEFNKIYSKSLRAQGVNQRDFAKNMQDTTEKTKHFKIAIENVGDAFASSLKPAVDAGMDGLGAVAQWASDVIVKYPVVGQLIGGVAIGFAGLTGAIGLATAAQWAWNTSVVAGSVSMLGRWKSGLLALGSRVLPLVATGIRAVGVAMAASPIGAAIAGIALAAGLIYEYWTPITGFFKSLWSGIKSIFSSVSKWIGTSITHPIDALKNTLGSAWDSLFGAAKPIAAKAAPAALAAIMALASPAAAAPVVQQDNRANYTMQINVNGGNPDHVKAAVSEALAEKEREHAARTRGALFDIQGG